MAYLKPVRKKKKDGTITTYWFAESRGKEYLKPRSLDTTDEGIAEEVTLSWEIGNNSHKARVKKITLSILVERFLKYKKTNVRPSSVKRCYNSMNCLMNVIGKTCPVNIISNKSIEDFKSFYKGKHKNNGININLRNIRSLFIWAVQEGYMKKRPIIKMMPTTEKIKYIKDSDWDKILRLDIDSFYKNVFILLRGIGVRRSDAILGELDGQFLVIDADNEKTGINKEVLLTDTQVELVKELHRERDKFLKTKNIRTGKYKQIDSFKRNISVAFQMCCKEIGIYVEDETTLHCLRHTYAVRKYIETRDIFLVCKLLHHKNVSTTERYARLNIHRLEQDFPRLVERVKNSVSETNNVETHHHINPNPPLIN